jgi:cobalamin-dependent methionine synthase I
MLIIGERINSSRKSIARAIEGCDRGFIQKEARDQAEAGAHFIDVNAGTFVGEEKEKLTWVMEAVQEVVDLPLSIDSPDPHVIREVLRGVRKAPMINSITLEPARMDGILPLVVEHKAKVIALCQSEEAMAETADDKLRLAEQLAERATQVGIPLDDLYIDPLVYPIATNPQSALAALEAIGRIMTSFPGIHTTCGLTNVSYGIPNRKLINRTFLVAAMDRGLDCAILDPTDKALYGALRAAMAVLGKDEYCMDYITAHREGRLA